MYSAQPRSLSTARLYFRRWTRSSAAVFHSLGHCVTIGHLSSSVLERLSAKTTTLATTPAVCGTLAPTEGSREEAEILEEGMLLELHLALTLTPQSTVSAHPAGYISVALCS